MGEFKDQVIVVTGGGSGIGKACAILFGQERAVVVVLDSDEDSAKTTVREIEAEGGTGLAIKTDVGDAQQVKASIAKTVERLGKIDILFANAAVQAIQPIDEQRTKNGNGSFLQT